MRAAISTEYIASDPPTYRSYYPAEAGLRATLRRRSSRDFGWSRAVRRPRARRRLRHAARCSSTSAGVGRRREPNFQLQVLGSAFYRNKAAYVVGKIVNGNDETPFVVPVLHDADGRLALDTVLFDPESIDVLFSLSRAYFMVDMDVPSGYVEFLQIADADEAALGALHARSASPKQGKTLFFRDLLHHLHHSRDLVRRGARHARPGHARLHPAVVPVRVQGDQGRVRARRSTPTARR